MVYIDKSISYFQKLLYHIYRYIYTVYIYICVYVYCVCLSRSRPVPPSFPGCRVWGAARVWRSAGLQGKAYLSNGIIVALYIRTFKGNTGLV